METLKEIRTRAQNLGLPFKIWGRLASTQESKIYQPDVSHWLDGENITESKRNRLMKTLAQVEDLCASTVAKIALNDADNVRIALQQLETLRANPATAPWQSKSEGASAAGTILSGAQVE